jgi:hypothetical protein
LMNFLIISDDEYRLWSSLASNFLQPPTITYSPWRSNIPFSILISNTRNICYFVNVREKISQPYKTTGNIKTYSFNIFVFKILGIISKEKRRQCENIMTARLSLTWHHLRNLWHIFVFKFGNGNSL